MCVIKNPYWQQYDTKLGLSHKGYIDGDLYVADEIAAVKAMLHGVYESLPVPASDYNAYILSRSGNYNMAVAGLPNSKFTIAVSPL